MVRDTEYIASMEHEQELHTSYTYGSIGRQFEISWMILKWLNEIFNDTKYNESPTTDRAYTLITRSSIVYDTDRQYG